MYPEEQPLGRDQQEGGGGAVGVGREAGGSEDCGLIIFYGELHTKKILFCSGFVVSLFHYFFFRRSV